MREARIPFHYSLGKEACQSAVKAVRNNETNKPLSAPAGCTVLSPNMQRSPKPGISLRCSSSQISGGIILFH